MRKAALFSTPLITLFATRYSYPHPACGEGGGTAAERFSRAVQPQQTNTFESRQAAASP